MMRAMLFFGVVALALLSGQPVFALLPLADTPDGMTCQFHMAGVRAEWSRRGGDWIDAAGVSYGDKAYVLAEARPSPSRQTIEWDVTTLVREWVAGREPVGAVFLRNLRGSTVSFASREHVDIAARPALLVEWSDGQFSRWVPEADTSINCTTINSLGAGATFNVSSTEPAVLVFPFEATADRALRSARLELTSDKQWGTGSEIGVFKVLPPWAKASEIRTGIASAYPGDQNIASHPAVFFADGFETRNWSKRWSTYGPASVTDIVKIDRANAFEPLQNKALRTTLRPTQNLGLDLRYDFEKLHGVEPEEAYFRYYLRFGDNWNPTADGGKLPGFAGTYNRGGWGQRKSDGTNGWSARGAFFKIQPNFAEMNGFAGVGSYVYHALGEAGGGANWGWGMGPTGRLRKNQWYSIEQYVKMNDPGVSNGVLRAWVDGQLVFERTDLFYRTVPELKIENVWFNVYHGGVERPSQEMALYIDNIVIAREYIGPMVGR